MLSCRHDMITSARLTQSHNDLSTQKLFQRFLNYNKNIRFYAIKVYLKFYQKLLQTKHYGLYQSFSVYFNK